MNNGAIFVKRIAPFFLPVMPPALRAFLFLDENFAPAISRQAKRIRLNGIALYENPRWVKLAAMSSGSEKLSPFGKSLDENRKSRPRQFARCPATVYGVVCTDMGWFVTRTKFWSRGLGGGFAGRYLIAQSRPVLLMKIALVSARAFRQEPMRIRYHGIYSVRKSRLFASVEMSVGTRDSSAIRKSLDENWLPCPRQSARCPAV